MSLRDSSHPLICPHSFAFVWVRTRWVRTGPETARRRWRRKEMGASKKTEMGHPIKSHSIRKTPKCCILVIRIFVVRQMCSIMRHSRRPIVTNNSKRKVKRNAQGPFSFPRYVPPLARNFNQVTCDICPRGKNRCRGWKGSRRLSGLIERKQHFTSVHPILPVVSNRQLLLYLPFFQRVNLIK